MLGTNWVGFEEGATVNELHQAFGRPSVMTKGLFYEVVGNNRTNLALTGASLTEYDYRRWDMVLVPTGPRPASHASLS